MDNTLFDKEIATPILDALGTSMQELQLVAGASELLTLTAGEEPMVVFCMKPAYMKNRANKVTVTQHKDGTYSVSFARYNRGEIDRIDHCEKSKLYSEWCEHTACAIQIPILAHMDLFGPGRIVATRGAMETFMGFEIRQALNLHLSGDWGEVCREDKKLNKEALKDGSRILSAYTYRGHKMWIITNGIGMDGKRDSTTVLLPDEY